jgi:signal transduction histidine kinase/CheY-like chemotaxis protein
MRTPFVRFLATFAFSVAAAWSTVTGALDVRFSMALVVSAGLFWGRGALISGLVGLGSAYLLMGTSSEHSVVDGRIGSLIAIAVLAVVETLALYAVIERTVAHVQSVKPAIRIWRFLMWAAILAVVGGWGETLVVSWFDSDVAMSSVSQSIGIAIAAVIAAIFASRKGSHWFRYDKSFAAELLAPLVVVMMTLVAVEITRQVWERQDEDTLSFVAEAAQTGFLESAAEQLSMLSLQVETSDAVISQDSSRFEDQLQTLVLGQSEISVAALVNIDASGSLSIDQSLSRLESPSVNSFKASVGKFDGAKLIADEKSDVQLLGIEDIASSGTSVEPNVFFALPIKSDSPTSQSQQYVVVAYSIPELLRSGISAFSGLVSDVRIEIGTVLATSSNSVVESVWLEGEPDVQPTQSMTSDGLIGDLQLRFTASPMKNFGVEDRSTLLVLGIEVLFGLAMLLVLLQGANAQYQLFLERRRRELLLEAALDATPGKSVVFDESLKVLAANQEVRDEFPGAIPGLDVTAIFGLTPDSGRARLVVDALRQALDGEVARAELGEDDLDSSMRIVEIEAYPIHGMSNDRVGFLHATDSTERRSLAMRSSQSERMESLGALAGGLAHDFNNLLFVTLGNLQLMAMNETIANDEKLSKFVSRSMSAVERGAEITKSLLAVARSQPLEESAVTLSDLVKGLLPLMRQALGAGRQVEVDIPDPNVQLMVDAGRLSSCILNLTFNSRDAMGPTGTLKISARQVSETQTLELSVADDGKGMPADVVARAFEPFFTTKRAGSGTGLGLATVYAFAKQSGGTAYLESRLGVGTTVTLSLPIHTGLVKADERAVQRRSGRRVVVADDEQSLAEMVASWLIDMGVDARFETSPKAALELIETFEPDVLVSDANFGEEMDGIQLARLAVAIVPDLAVIFMTGYSASMKELQEQGERTLAKPFSREDLYSALSPLIAEVRDGEDSEGGEKS